MNFYKVDVMFGHVGKGKYVIKSVPIKAENGRDAAKKARNMARVKRHRKDAIREVKLISNEEFNLLKIEHENDNYFKVTCIQDQRALCPELVHQIEAFDERDIEQQKIDDKKRRALRKKKVEYIQKIKKIINDDINNYLQYAEFELYLQGE
jgi:hypothetical protein